MRMVKMSPANGQGSLVDYLVQQMDEKFPGELEGMLAPGREAEHIKQTARFQFEEFFQDTRAFVTKAKTILQKIRAIDVSEETAFVQHREIIAMSIVDVEELERRQSKLESTFVDLCAWFCMRGSNTKKTCEGFFGMWDKFLDDILMALKASQVRAQEAQGPRSNCSHHDVLL